MLIGQKAIYLDNASTLKAKFFGFCFENKQLCHPDFKISRLAEKLAGKALWLLLIFYE